MYGYRYHQHLLSLLFFVMCAATTTISTTSRRIGRFVAYVGVRGGSDRCPRKNVRPFFQNKSLLDLKLEILQQVTQLKEIVVSSDCEEMLAIARWHNNHSPSSSSPPIRAVARDPYFCSDDVHVSEYFEHIAVKLEDVADHILYAPVTAPLLQVNDFNMLLESFKNSDPTVHDAVSFFLKRQGHFWFENKPLNYDDSMLENTQLAEPIRQMPYSGMIVDTHMLKASKSFLGFNKRRPPVMVDLPFDRVMEIDSCTDFKIAQLLYQEQHDKSHQNNSKAAAVSANTHSTFEISVDVPGQGLRRFVVGNMHDETTSEKNAQHFCLVHGGSRGVCEKELLQSVAMKKNEDSVQVSVSTAIPSGDVWVKTMQLWSELWSGAFNTSTKGSMNLSVIGQGLSKAAQLAAVASIQHCKDYGLVLGGPFCQDMIRQLSKVWRKRGIQHLANMYEATEVGASMDDRQFGEQNKHSHMHNRALFLNAGWESFFEEHLQNNIDAEVAWPNDEIWKLCMEEQTSCHVCGRCFRLVNATHAAENNAWYKNVKQKQHEQLSSKVRHAKITLFAIPIHNRWWQFVDGKDHYRGEFAYEREAIESLPSWFSGQHSAFMEGDEELSPGHDLWQDNSLYISRWHLAYAKMAHTLGISLNAELICQFWIWLMNDEGLNRPFELSASDVHVNLHRNGSTSYRAMLRGVFLGGDDGFGFCHQHQKSNTPTYVQQICQDRVRFGLVDTHDAWNAPLKVWERLVEFTARYQKSIVGLEDGSEQLLESICLLSYSILMFHPFGGGNSRIATMVLHRELALHGFSPVIMYNTHANQFKWKTFSDFIDLVKEGIAVWKQATSPSQTSSNDSKGPWLNNDSLKVLHKKRFPNFLNKKGETCGYNDECFTSE
jgi:CMP-N-acetylneuraminic acid synthetase